MCQSSQLLRNCWALLWVLSKPALKILFKVANKAVNNRRKSTFRLEIHMIVVSRMRHLQKPLSKTQKVKNVLLWMYQICVMPILMLEQRNWTTQPQHKQFKMKQRVKLRKFPSLKWNKTNSIEWWRQEPRNFKLDPIKLTMQHLSTRISLSMSWIMWQLPLKKEQTMAKSLENLISWLAQITKKRCQLALANKVNSNQLNKSKPQNQRSRSIITVLLEVLKALRDSKAHTSMEIVCSLTQTSSVAF